MWFEAATVSNTKCPLPVNRGPAASEYWGQAFLQDAGSTRRCRTSMSAFMDVPACLTTHSVNRGVLAQAEICVSAQHTCSCSPSSGRGQRSEECGSRAQHADIRRGLAGPREEGSDREGSCQGKTRHLLLLGALGRLLALLGAGAAQCGAGPGALVLVRLRNLGAAIVVHPVHPPQVRQHHVQLARLQKARKLMVIEQVEQVEERMRTESDGQGCPSAPRAPATGTSAPRPACPPAMTSRQVTEKTPGCGSA